MRAHITLFPVGIFAAQQIDARPTAHIKLVRDEAISPDPLFAQILKRRTNRQAYDMRMPPQKSLKAILNSSYPYPLVTSFATQDTPSFMEQHRRIAKEAWRIELTTPRTMLESMKVLRVGPKEIAEHRDGVINNEPMLQLINALGLLDRNTAPNPQDSTIIRMIEAFNAKIDATPA
ncbi:MAG: twin-arginine translocation pathway signal protein, partial [Pseudanabaena sp.]